jgi:hypothetical protein
MLSKYIRHSTSAISFSSQASLIQTTSRSYNKVLQYETLSEAVKKAEYAVRGKIPLRGEEIQTAINKGEKFPFSKTTSLNIGNP